MDLTEEQKQDATVYLKRISHIATRELGNMRSLKRMKKEIETQLLLMDELVIKQ